jgi:uncharacterized membrane protein YkvA (DUF1232 family)
VFARLARALTLLRDPRVARLPKFAVFAVLVYTVWPMDLVPDWFVPVVGWFDDLTLVWLALRWLLRSDPAAPMPPPPVVTRPSA